eukprot:PLAT13789.1.p1 GENE.PLAT13789.1~~PLAT13789.1.p1  ORF type:complete len:406 (+),score=226.56 PLAT13789.1:32-1219(+)
MDASAPAAAPAAAAAAEEEGGEEEDEEEGKVSDADVGAARAPDGHWASAIRLFNPVTAETVQLLELSDNEAAVSICCVAFAGRGGEEFVVVGSVKDLAYHPRRLTCGYIRVYRLLEGSRLQLLHRTKVQAVPQALAAFQGTLLAGVGSTLRLYHLGRSRLLRKAERTAFPTTIVRIETLGDRVFVGDAQESVHFVKYVRESRTLEVFADDTAPRHVVAMAVLDYDTVAVGDKFGHVSVLRLPEDVSDDVTGGKLLWSTGLLNGAPNKVKLLATYYTGGCVTALQKASLVPGGSPALYFATSHGALGALLPCKTSDDVEFFSHLELYMRQEAGSLVGREHVSYRSYYEPVKSVTDGDLCETFTLLEEEAQARIAEGLDCTVDEVMKKLEDCRHRLL